MSIPTNILLATRPLTPPWDEASKNFAYFLARSIRNPELKLHLLTTERPLEGLGDNCVEHPIYPKNDENHAGFPLSQKIQIPIYLARYGHKFDIIHYLFTPTKLNSFITKHFVSKKAKTIQTIATLREDILTPADWKKLFFADQLVVYSDYSKVKLETEGFTNVKRIYPGIDLEKYSPQPKSPEAMKHFKITPEDCVVLYPGEYVRLGATDMLVEMLRAHRDEIIANHVIFVFGCRIKNEDDRKKKWEVVEKLTMAGVIDHVRFTDTWKDMPALYNLSDIVVFPVGDMKGKFDIPLAIIEPYACAKPVILSDLEIFQEFSNPQISVTIPKGNGEALWHAIEDLRCDEAKRKSLGTNARGFVEKHFDLEQTAEKYQQVYLKL